MWGWYNVGIRNANIITYFLLGDDDGKRRAVLLLAENSFDRLEEWALQSTSITFVDIQQYLLYNNSRAWFSREFFLIWWYIRWWAYLLFTYILNLFVLMCIFIGIEQFVVVISLASTFKQDLTLSWWREMEVS